MAAARTRVEFVGGYVSRRSGACRGSEGRPSFAGWACAASCAERERDTKNEWTITTARVRRLRDCQQEIRTLGGIASASTRGGKVGKLPGLAPKGNPNEPGSEPPNGTSGGDRDRGAPHSAVQVISFDADRSGPFWHSEPLETWSHSRATAGSACPLSAVRFLQIFDICQRARA